MLLSIKKNKIENRKEIFCEINILILFYKLINFMLLSI